jgi:hypothetical protein
MKVNDIKSVKFGGIEIEMWKIQQKDAPKCESNNSSEKISLEEAFRIEQEKLSKIDMGIDL